MSAEHKTEAKGESHTTTVATGSKVYYGHPFSNTKIIYWVRHGQATSNAAAGGQKTHPAYESWDYFDARLSPLGKEQAEALSAQTQKLTPQIILVSPLSRALQTATIGFSHQKVPFICKEELRERMGQHPCDKRRKISEVSPEFPNVDFSQIKSDDDVLWSKDHRESNDELASRIYHALEYIQSRPEKEIAIVGHSSFLELLFNNVLVVSDEKLKVWFENCELRSTTIAFPPK